MRSSATKFLGLVVVACLAAGCGSGGPSLYKAVGTVTYKGQPVDGATVNFIYENGDTATGVTDAGGKFQLFRLASTGGAAAGKGAMTVTKISQAASQSPSMPAMPNAIDTKNPANAAKSMDELKKKMESGMGQPPAAPKNELPAKYLDSKTSGLNFEILPNNSNNFTIELKD